jgi:hypothetical protein
VVTHRALAAVDDRRRASARSRAGCVTREHVVAPIAPPHHALDAARA